MPPTSLPLIDEPRDDLGRVPLGREEKARWLAEAAAAGRSFAEHVRITYEAGRSAQSASEDQPRLRDNPFANVAPVAIHNN